MKRILGFFTRRVQGVFFSRKMCSAHKYSLIMDFGELQYCSNNVATPRASFFTFINLVVRNKLGSDDVVCTSTSSYCKLSLDQLAQVF